MNKNQVVKQFIKGLCFSKPQRITTEVLKAASHETYVETVGNAADTLHLGLDGWTVESLQQTYSRFCERKIRTFHLGTCDVIIDITKEPFYGNVQGLWIHPWTGKQGIQGHYQFLVCSVKFRNKKYVLGVRMLRIGAIIADEISALLDGCSRAGFRIREVLLDRGFYTADVLRELQEHEVFYLVFTPRNSLFKNMLDGTEKSVTVEHSMQLRKDKTRAKIPTNIALVKDVRDHDWIFATNLNLSARGLVKRYIIRWNIETDFRVQDEARIKSKSKRPEVRLFYFLISSLLVLVWNATQKFILPFKKFVILLAGESAADATRVAA